MSMYICRRTPRAASSSSATVVLEFTPQVLEEIHKAFPNATKSKLHLDLVRGTKLYASTTGTTWFQVVKPLTYLLPVKRCQITGEALKDVMYDGRTVHGPWAIMSEEGWQKAGCKRLGAGYGQKYRLNSEGDFYLSEGMALIPQAVG